MTALDVKEKLARILDASDALRIAQRNLEQAENLLTGISIDYSVERVTASQVSFDRIGDQVDQLAQLRTDYMEKRRDAAEQMAEGLALLNYCRSTRGYEVLSRRYIHGEGWEVIEDEMHYSERQLMRIQAEALDEIAAAMSANVSECQPDVSECQRETC